jgi:hypothetical protein
MSKRDAPNAHTGRPAGECLAPVWDVFLTCVAILALAWLAT